jgi:hypothetical protein
MEMIDQVSARSYDPSPMYAYSPSRNPFNTRGYFMYDQWHTPKFFLRVGGGEFNKFS